MTDTDSHRPATETPPTILVADDDPVMRTLTMEVLRTAGYTVIEAASGGLALELARTHCPDAIVIDLLMPQLSGTQVVQELRARSALRRIPVIMVSGVDDVGYRVRALTAGVNDFLVKPVAPAELLARVEAQLRIASTSSGDADPRRDAWRREVVRDQAFGVVFQPMVYMRNGQVIAQEALARFHDGTPPGEAFQSAGAIEPRTALELAVLERAVTHSRSLPDGVDLHVNVSRSAAQSPDLRGILARVGRPCVLEITENELFDQADAHALRAALPSDVRIATDDLGVGYAGLVQVLDVRPDVVKIDRAIVAWVDEDPARQALVAGLVQFGAATGCTLIAEGIERDEERQALVALGVNIGQGYLFGRPGAWPPPDPAEVWAHREEVAV
jgi:EAL domain-containing protein (putative c-di-GMP-specific phosphodiesterase class I)